MLNNDPDSGNRVMSYKNITSDRNGSADYNLHGHTYADYTGRKYGLDWHNLKTRNTTWQ